MSSYNSFLFDMDGVLVNSMDHHAACWIKIFKDFGLNLSKKEIYLREGMTGLGAIEDIFLSHECTVPQINDLRSIVDLKNNLFDASKISLYTHIEEILVTIKRSGSQLGVITGSDRNTFDAVIPYELSLLFDVIITSDDVKNGKPSAEPYAKALMHMGETRDKALIIENAPMGIQSAVNAGIYCVALCTTLSAEHLSDANVVLKDHFELRSYISDLIN